MRLRAAAGTDHLDRFLVGLLIAVFTWLWIAPAAASEGEHHSVVVLLDKSGSMKSSDPTEVRLEACRLLLGFLKPGDRVHIA